VSRAPNRRRSSHEPGQALVEFSLTIPIFLLMLVAVFDVGRGIYTYNALSEAARDLARISATHVGLPVGTSDATVQRIAAIRGITPAMSDPVFICTDLYGASVAAEDCTSGDYVRVTVTAPYTPDAFLGLGGTINLTSTSSVQVP